MNLVLHFYETVSQFEKETLALKSVDSYRRFQEAHGERIHMA